MDSLRKIFGVIFAILFILTAVPALILSNFDRNAFSVETYQKAFVKVDFYNKIPELMAKAMLSPSTDQNQFPIVMQGMSQEAWEEFFQKLLPADMLKAMGDDILKSTFAYLNMQSDSVQLSMIPLKTSLVSDNGVQAVFALLNTLPDCTLQQLGQITIDLLTNSEIQLCNPPEKLYPLLRPVIQAQMQATALAIPDQLTLISAPAEKDTRIRLHFVRLIMRLSPILPLIFLLLMTICIVNSLESWLIWWGIPLFITGILASIMSLSGAPLFSAVLQRFLINRMPAYLPTILLDYTRDLASAMIRAMLNPVLWQGLVIAVLGFIMILVYFFIGNKPTRKIKEQSEAKTLI
jgi:hypothetical protein